MKYRVNEKELIEIVKRSLSKADVLRKMDLRPVGSNYKSLDIRLKKWKIDVTHFTGQGWNTGDRFRMIRPEIPLSEILIENSTYTNNTNLKNKLIKQGLMIYMCKECKIKEWNKKEIVLELNHINGINTDNRIENLELLCPNCHSQTNNFRGKNINKSSKSELKKNRYLKSLHI